MQLTFLGKDTVNGGSPTLFATDRNTYVVQGWKVPGDESSVEIPDRLLSFLELGTKLDVPLRDTGLSTYRLSGEQITDVTALALMNIPGHETAVEVGRVREEDTDGSTAG